MIKNSVLLAAEDRSDKDCLSLSILLGSLLWKRSGETVFKALFFAHSPLGMWLRNCFGNSVEGISKIFDIEAACVDFVAEFLLSITKLSDLHSKHSGQIEKQISFNYDFKVTNDVRGDNRLRTAVVFGAFCSFTRSNVQSATGCTFQHGTAEATSF